MEWVTIVGHMAYASDKQAFKYKPKLRNEPLYSLKDISCNKKEYKVIPTPAKHFLNPIKRHAAFLSIITIGI